MLCGFDDDLTGQILQVSNRDKGLLAQIHPALERVIGPRLDHPAMLDLLQRYPSPAAIRAAGEEIAVKVEKIVVEHPLQPILTSVPRVGARTATRFLPQLATKAFPAAAHLAAYAGLVPATRRSGSTIRGEHPSGCGNEILKCTMFLSAFTALRDSESRAYYDRKITQGKRHNQALIALAR